MEKTEEIQAFPWIREFHVNGIEGKEHMQGMTLRDWFAGQALIMTEKVGLQYSKEELAMNCYQYADAMLAERAK